MATERNELAIGSCTGREELSLEALSVCERDRRCPANSRGGKVVYLIDYDIGHVKGLVARVTVFVEPVTDGGGEM